MDSTERAGGGLSPLVERAAAGEPPAWGALSAPRREHVARVVALLDEWAEALALPAVDRKRWRAAGWLHDALREAPAEALRPEVPPSLGDLAPPLLHGPAAAERLAGLADDSIRAAVRYHTIGHPSLDTLGRALYLADFLEPGRDFLVRWRAGLRARMPHDLDGVLVEVLAARIRHLLEGRRPIRPETAAFWSQVVAAGR